MALPGGLQPQHEVPPLVLPLIALSINWQEAKGPLTRPFLLSKSLMHIFQRLSLYTLLLALTALVYAKGLQGGFLFDDYANLPALGATGPVHDAPSFWRFVTSGTADPLGRPVALLSFLLDAQDWPASAYSFKRTNLVLHMINGLLLAIFLRQLGYVTRSSHSQIQQRYELAAILGAALWMLHPLFVSTTLYIVQREAMLPATFTLIGLLLWLRGRKVFLQGHITAGCIYLASSLGACTALAALSKANGALLPALALCVEFFFLVPLEARCTIDEAPPRRRRLYWTAMAPLAFLPSALIAGYLLFEGWRGLVHGISAVRPWTLSERLLTEPRVLADYLKLLWVPRPFTAGLFNDQITASSSLWSPASTLPSLLAILSLLVAAVALRRRSPALALAIAFYFVGQSIESTTIGLELYFEHRNYLPAMPMFWPLALWLCGASLTTATQSALPTARASLVGKPIRGLISLILIGGLGWMTYAQASLWGNTRDQALLWAKLNPDSPRAQAYAGQAEVAAGHSELAVARLRAALTRAPDQIQLALNLLAAQCEQGSISIETLEGARVALRTTRDTGTLLAGWFGRALEQINAPSCPQMNLAGIEDLLTAAMSNQRLMDTPGRRQDLYHLRGLIALRQKDPNKALADFNLALDQQVRATAAFEQAAILGSAGYPSQGSAHLDHYQAASAREISPDVGMPRLHAWIMERQHYWDNELVRLRETLRKDMLDQHPNHSPHD